MRSTTIFFFIASSFCALLPTPQTVLAEEQKPLKEPNVATAQALLQEASAILRKQDAQHNYWIERLLLDVAKVQMGAGDIDGALHTTQASDYQYGRYANYLDLARHLARQGKRDRAIEVMQHLGTKHGWRQDFLEEGVQINSLEYLITSGQIEQAVKACDQIKTTRYRPTALLKLAVAYAKSNKPEETKKYFAQVLQAADTSKEQYERAHHYWNCAKAQLEAGLISDAKETLAQLEKHSTAFEAWARIAALREAAVLNVCMQDQPSAKRLFQLAISLQPQVNDLNREGALKYIALSQLEAGYMEEARQTISTIPVPKNEEVLEAISAVHLKNGDLEGALKTALEVRQYLQYKEGALNKIIAYQISKREYDNAVKTAEKIGDTSKQAIAILKIATALAVAGEKQKAMEVAKRISLTCTSEDFTQPRQEVFDYRLPRTWGINYQHAHGFTNNSRRLTVETAAEVAAAAMKLFQALELKPENSYHDLFYEVRDGRIIQALARAHAATGNVEEAIVWTKTIGSDEKIEQSEDYSDRLPVQQRVHALIGTAEGILDRTNSWPQPSFDD